MLALLPSCSDSFLETAPTASVATSTVFESVENVKMAINAMAEQMCSQHAAYTQGYCGENRIMSIYNEYTSQEFRYNQIAPGWDVFMNGAYYSMKTTTYATYPWGYYYEIISDANSVVCNVDGAKGTDSEKAFYKASARTMRSYSFVKLLELYSKRWQDTQNGTTSGVVMRMDESTGSMPVSTVAECYKLIYEDLDAAIAEFKASGMDRAAGEVWLPNLNVAYAVYARAALHKEDYGTALKMAQEARKGYDLMSNADYKAGFCNPTSEWIFGSYADQEENNWYWTFGTQFACNGYYADATAYGTGDIEKELTDRMPTNDVRMKLFLTEDKFGGLDLYNGKGTVEDRDGNVTLDVPHMNKTYGTIDSDEAWMAGYKYIQSMTPKGLTPAYRSGYFYLNSQLKFWVFGTPGLSYLPFIRSSEMLLIEAEANYFLHNETDAQKNLEELNKESGRNPNYACAKTGDSLFQEIVDYRELELWGEGFNWYDVKRWNRDIVRKSFEEGGNCHSATAVTVKASDGDWTWAIPENETQFNDDIED